MAQILGHWCPSLCIFDHIPALLPSEVPLHPSPLAPSGQPNPKSQGPRHLLLGSPGVGTFGISPWSPMAALEVPHPSREGSGTRWSMASLSGGPALSQTTWSEPQVHHLPAWRPWADYSTFLSLGYPICEGRITIAPASPGRGENEMRWSVIKALSVELA